MLNSEGGSQRSSAIMSSFGHRDEPPHIQRKTSLRIVCWVDGYLSLIGEYLLGFAPDIPPILSRRRPDYPHRFLAVCVC